MPDVRIPRPETTSYEVLSAVVKWWRTNSRGPTIEQIREDVGLRSKSTVAWHVDKLVEDQWLTRAPRRHQALKPTRRGTKLVELMEAKDDAATEDDE